MDNVFLLGPDDRSIVLHRIMLSFGCTHICVWSHMSHPSNCFLYLDGMVEGLSDPQPSSISATSHVQLFNMYRESVIYLGFDGVPGFAFKNGLSYMELKFHDFAKMARNPVQLQFYQEAVKAVVFMASSFGEIELGFPCDPQDDLESQLNSLLASVFSQQTLHEDPSTSSLHSLSMGSNEYPYLHDIAPSTSFGVHSRDNAINAMASIRPMNKEREEDIMTKAIIEVLRSSDSSPSSSQQKSSAFNRYERRLVPPIVRSPRRSMIKRSLSFLRKISMRRMQESRIQENRFKSAQLHHTISERKRRERLNESFRFFRSLLPPKSKKDKASVLVGITEYLVALKSQVEELTKRNQELESQLTIRNQGESSHLEQDSTEMRNVEVSLVQVSQSTSESRFIDLRVSVRGEHCSIMDILTRILGFLKLSKNLRLNSVQTNLRTLESGTVHGLVLRLKIEGDEFDELGFGEAVREVVKDFFG